MKCAYKLCKIVHLIKRLRCKPFLKLNLYEQKLLLIFNSIWCYLVTFRVESVQRNGRYNSFKKEIHVDLFQHKMKDRHIFKAHQGRI